MLSFRFVYWKRKMDKRINLQFLLINTLPTNLECSICYKSIKKMFFACPAPCHKVFHTSCLEHAMEQTEALAAETDVEAVHKCCYCRRQINIDNYWLQLFARRLTTLGAIGYLVKPALASVEFQLKHNQFEDIAYDIYELNATGYFKKPKQSNLCRQKTRPHKPRIILKHNIGGRRR